MSTDFRRVPALFLVLCCASLAAAMSPEESAHFVARYRQIVIIYAQDAIDKSAALSECIDDFLARPTDPGLEKCRNAWLESHEAYLKGRFFARLAAGQSDRASAVADELEFAIDAWPIEEGYLDGLEAYPTSGIVNDLTVPIDEASLRKQHGLTDRTEVALGFHPLEFLLWRKRADDFLRATELTDEQRADGMTLADLPADRRRALVQLIARLLTHDIELEFEPLATPTPREYAEDMHSMNVRVVYGCSAAWRRLRGDLVLYTAGGPEGRHSRFSGSSARDLRSRAEAVASLLLRPGRYIDQLAPLDPALAERYEEEIAATLDALGKLPGTTSDRAASGPARTSIDRLIDTSSRFEQYTRAR